MIKAETLIRTLDACLAPLGMFRARAMFGGHGLYLDDVMFGLIFANKLYLKTDDATRTAFEKSKSKSFVYHGQRGAIVTSYWLCPPAVLKDARKLREWIGRAREVARRKKAAKPKRRSRATSAP